MRAERETQKSPRVSLIIPSIDGHRDGMVPKLLASIESQSFRDYEVHLIAGVKPQGMAINLGAQKARGEILIIMDDDSELADTNVLANLVGCVDSSPRIGMAGASIVLSPDATPFQQRAAREFPRLHTPVVHEMTDSDLACHGCCAIPSHVFNEVGREREELIRGLDPDLRVRLRQAGYRVVLAPETCIYHPLPRSWNALLKTFFRNGYGSAYAQKVRPDLIYETHEALHSSSFQPRRPLLYRLCRFPLRLGLAILQGKLLRFSAYCGYAAGYLWGALSVPKPAGMKKAPE